MSEMYNFSWFSLYNHHNFKSDTSDFQFNGSIDGWSYSANHRSVNKEFVSDNNDREELALGLSKNFAISTNGKRRLGVRRYVNS